MLDRWKENYAMFTNDASPDCHALLNLMEGLHAVNQVSCLI